METSSLFQSYTYGDGNDKAVALVAGFASQSGGGKDLDQAAVNFAARGYDVVRYTHPKEILANGNPGDLLNLIDSLSNDFRERTIGHKAVRFCGASLGGAIAGQMQRFSDNPERGYYAATGGILADIVTDPWFNSLVMASQKVSPKRAFERNGYGREELRTAWSELQTIPTTPLTLALGGIDRIVSKRAVKENLAQWRTYNPDIEVIYAPLATHADTIARFNRSLTKLALDEQNRGIRPAPTHQPARKIVDLSASLKRHIPVLSSNHALAA